MMRFWMCYHLIEWISFKYDFVAHADNLTVDFGLAYQVLNTLHNFFKETSVKTVFFHKKLERLNQCRHLRHLYSVCLPKFRYDLIETTVSDNRIEKPNSIFLDDLHFLNNVSLVELSTGCRLDQSVFNQPFYSFEIWRNVKQQNVQELVEGCHEGSVVLAQRLYLSQKFHHVLFVRFELAIVSFR